MADFGLKICAPRHFFVPRTFVVSIRNTADTLKSQPDTRAGKPNKQQL